MKNILLVKKTDPFALTGSGKTENWSHTDWTPLFPDNNPVHPGFLTKLKIMYSGKGLYFLFECEDHYLHASLNKPLSHLWKEDAAEIFLWPDTEKPVYFEYEISPLNNHLPLIVSNYENQFTRWHPFDFEVHDNIRIQHSTSVSGGEKKSGASVSSWTAEFFIPFDLLRMIIGKLPEPGTTWKANFYRIDYHPEPSYWSWQPFEQSFHERKHFGTLLFE